MLDDTGIDYDLELFTTQMGYEGKGVEPIVKAISDAHEIVAGKPLPPLIRWKTACGPTPTSITSSTYLQ
jgi:hypothetical protein